ncbi:MAG: cell division protein FtsZ, partial [Bacteroidota bacterium]
MNMEEGLQFNLPKNRSSVIKVIGVGGGGSNAVNYMANVGVHGVDFVVCNTDAQALEHSPVKNKIQLGASLTEGLGAGADPEIGRQAAEESIAQIQKILETGTKMCFVTAGMGGGTGTGAAPIIAKASRDMGILTVGIVTAPFSFEGKNRAEQAENGIRAMREAVDSLIVINNDKLRQVYGDLGFRNAFSKADEVLAGAAKGIAEVITNHYTANIDLRDAKTVLENSGSALFGTGKGEGAQRAMNAVQEALDSPLLNDNHIKGAKNVLLLVTSGAGENEVTIDEIGEITDHIQREAGGNANIIMGIGGEEEEGTNITCTIIATGFPTGTRVLPTDKPEMVVHELTVDNSTEVVMPTEPEKIIMTLEDEDEDEMPIAEAQQAPIIEDIMEEDVVEEAVEEVIAESVDPEVLYMEEEEFLGFPKLASDEDFEAAMETSMNDL